MRCHQGATAGGPTSQPLARLERRLWGSETVGGNTTAGSQGIRACACGVVTGADDRVWPTHCPASRWPGGGTGFSLANGLGSGSADLFQPGAYVRHTIGAAYALAYAGMTSPPTGRRALHVVSSGRQAEPA